MDEEIMHRSAQLLLLLDALFRQAHLETVRCFDPRLSEQERKAAQKQAERYLMLVQDYAAELANVLYLGRT